MCMGERSFQRTAFHNLPAHLKLPAPAMVSFMLRPALNHLAAVVFFCFFLDICLFLHLTRVPQATMQRRRAMSALLAIGSRRRSPEVFPPLVVLLAVRALAHTSAFNVIYR